MTVGILWAAMLGCSQDGSSVTTAAPCAVPVLEAPKPMLGCVSSSGTCVAGNGPWVRLEWDASSNASGYRLYIGNSSQSYQQVEDVGAVTKSVVSNLASNMTYYFAVTAYNSAAESCPSNEVSAHTS